MAYNWFMTGVLSTLAVVCAGIFLQRKERDALVMTLLALLLVPLALLGNRFALVTAPVTWACVVVAGIVLRREHKRRT